MTKARNKNMLRHWLASVFEYMKLALAFCLIAIVCVPLRAQATSPPTISPGTGLFASGPTVSLAASSGTIFYTTDGTQPSTSSQTYSSSFTVNGTTTVNAIAVESGTASAVTSATLTVDPTIWSLQQGTNPSLWLRADTGVTADGSNNVSSWLDLSGNGNTATQATSDDEPQLLANDYNAFSAVSLASSKFLDLPSGFASLSAPNLYFVTKPTNSANSILLDLGNGGLSDNVQASTDGGSTTFTVNEGSTPGSISASSALSLGQYQLISMSQASGSGSISVNGVSQTTGTLGTPADTTRSENHIGVDYSEAANFYDGNLLEALVFPDGIGSDLVETYLITRYQLLNAVPEEPVISVVSATLDGPTQVAIATPANCVCKFTTDGTTPTSSSQTYTGPLNIYYSQTLQAVAFNNGVASDAASATYMLDSTRWPAPSSGDSTQLQINLQSPTN